MTSKPPGRLAAAFRRIADSSRFQAIVIVELERERTELVAAAFGDGEADDLMKDRLDALRRALDDLERSIVERRGG